MIDCWFVGGVFVCSSDCFYCLILRLFVCVFVCLIGCWVVRLVVVLLVRLFVRVVVSLSVWRCGCCL